MVFVQLKQKNAYFKLSYTGNCCVVPNEKKKALLLLLAFMDVKLSEF
jgi:hypothetical protein